MYTLKIKVTKDIIQKSLFCGYHSDGITKKHVGAQISKNCAFSVAIREIFPQASVLTYVILTCPLNQDGIDYVCGYNRYPTDPQLNAKYKIIPNTPAMSEFIRKFDNCNVEGRLNLQEEEFDLPIPDYIIDDIDITEIQKVLATTEHLELVEA